MHVEGNVVNLSPDLITCPTIFLVTAAVFLACYDIVFLIYNIPITDIVHIPLYMYFDAKKGSVIYTFYVV